MVCALSMSIAVPPPASVAPFFSSVSCETALHLRIAATLHSRLRRVPLEAVVALQRAGAAGPGREVVERPSAVDQAGSALQGS